jgi:penicillin-binding protein 1C
LGGGETSPWEISRIYKGLAQNYMGLSTPFNPIKILNNEIPEHLTSFAFNAYTIEHTINAMSNLSRPREDKSWQLFGYDHKIAWKTGTSYGHKDAWAAGFNKQYQVTVWVGNEYGEGRKDLTGIVRAAPILFKIFNILPDQRWFDTKPYSSSKTTITVCKETGRLKGDLCQHLKTMKIDKISHSLKTCDFHLINKSDTTLKFHPVVEYYYTLQNPQFKDTTDDKPLKIIYPDQGLKIYLPKTNATIKNGFLAKTNYKGGSVYWYLNKNYIGKSDGGQMIINAPSGFNQLLVVNESGAQDDITFEIIEN